MYSPEDATISKEDFIPDLVGGAGARRRGRYECVPGTVPRV